MRVALVCQDEWGHLGRRFVNTPCSYVVVKIVFLLQGLIGEKGMIGPIVSASE